MGGVSGQLHIIAWPIAAVGLLHDSRLRLGYTGAGTLLLLGAALAFTDFVQFLKRQFQPLLSLPCRSLTGRHLARCLILPYLLQSLDLLSVSFQVGIHLVSP